MYGPAALVFYACGRPWRGGRSWRGDHAAHSRAAVWLPFVAAGELMKEPDGAILGLKISEKRLTDLRVGDCYRIWVICIPRVRIWAKTGA